VNLTVAPDGAVCLDIDLDSTGLLIHESLTQEAAPSSLTLEAPEIPVEGGLSPTSPRDSAAAVVDPREILSTFKAQKPNPNPNLNPDPNHDWISSPPSRRMPTK